MAGMVRITAGSVQALAELNDTETARRILAALPIEARASTWGDETYFTIPVDCDREEDARTEVEVGDLGYWRPGTAFCIFFGRTPMSTGDKPVAASEVNVFGRLVGDPTVFRQVRAGERVLLEAAE